MEINIDDNEIGISQQDLPYIFERFYREYKSRNRFTGGAGIGLNIVKAIVHVHKGEIRVESKLGKDQNLPYYYLINMIIILLKY